MRYKLLGATGLRVSEVALGTATFGTAWGWGADAAGSAAIFERFAEAGGNLIDCADIYQEGESESILGELLGDDRDKFVVITKYTASTGRDIARSGNNRKHMIAAVEASLRRLGTDYIDVLLPHFWDGVTYPEELADGFDALVRAGKVRYVGVSNFPAWYTARLVTLARERGLAAPVAVQAEYNLLERTAEHELLPMCAALDVAVLGYSPLAAGRLTGRHRDESDAGRARYAHGQDARTEAISDAVRRLAGTAGCSGTQLAIAWVRARSTPSVIPVLGASDATQLAHTLEALDVVPAPELLAELDALSEPPPAFPSAVVRQAIRAQSTAGHHEQVDSHRPWGDGW